MTLTISVVCFWHHDAYTVPQLAFLLWEFASLGSHVHGGVSFAAYAQHRFTLLIKQESFFLYYKLQCNGIFLYLESSCYFLSTTVIKKNDNMYLFNYRILLQEKRNCLLMQLEEATRLTSYLHSQLKRWVVQKE